ncbi:MAG TPA: AAA family ATPase [Cyclobacteriaceae bacterium]|nr:AAA family ATPase [Cyclobacteriaceae bacterium]
MITRDKEKEIRKYLRHFPAVAITGPRQCGKSTLAKSIIARVKGAVYIDLEDPEDRVKLNDPYFWHNTSVNLFVLMKYNSCQNYFGF